MKVFFSLIILAIFACASAEQQEPALFGALSSTIESKLLKVRDQMPNGFPKYGIPPLAPLNIQHKQINVDKDNVKVDAILDDLIVSGLDDFEIEKLKFSLFSSKLDLVLLFKNITLDTQYDLKLWGEKMGLSLEVIGQGPATISVEDLRVTIGAKLKMSLGSGKFTLKTLDLAVQLGSITANVQGILGNGDINEKVNEFLSTELVDIVNDNVDILTDVVSTKVVDLVNGFLDTSSVGKFLLVEVFEDVPEEN